MHGNKRNTERLTIAHFAAAWCWLFVAMMAGAIMGAQLAGWRLFPGVELLSPGRWWTAHTNFMLWGFLLNVAIGLFYDLVPPISGQVLLSQKLSWFVFTLLQAVVTAAGIGIVTGYAQEAPWGEIPTFILPMLLATLTLAGINLTLPALWSDRPWPPAMWCFLAAGIALIINLTAIIFFPHQNNALAFNLIGFCVLPAGVGIFLWTIPHKELWPRRWLLLGGIAAAILVMQSVMQMLVYPSPLELRQWLVRNAYTILFGVFPLWMTSAVLAVVPRAFRSNWKNKALLQRHFWLTAFGLVLLLTDLLPSELVPGGGQPSPTWNPLVSGAGTFWKIQMAAGAAVLAGQICWIVNFVQTWRSARNEA